MENEESNEEITERQSSTTRYEVPTSRVMLEDNFRTLNTSLWKREIKMPLDPVGILSLFYSIVIENAITQSDQMHKEN